MGILSSMIDFCERNLRIELKGDGKEKPLEFIVGRAFDRRYKKFGVQETPVGNPPVFIIYLKDHPEQNNKPREDFSVLDYENSLDSARQNAYRRAFEYGIEFATEEKVGFFDSVKGIKRSAEYLQDNST